jgi:hypothetical protein
MNYVILEKSRVKAHVRTKKGHWERVVSYDRSGQHEKVFHGTTIGVIRKILEEGITSGKYHNWGDFYYKGRENKVFVTTSFEKAIFWAKAVAGRFHGSEKNAIIVEADIPKEYWGVHAEKDKFTQGNILPSVKPEWITNVYDTEGNLATKTFDSLKLERFQKADKGFIKVYIPLSEATLKRIIKEESQRDRLTG